MARPKDPKPGDWRFEVGEIPFLLTAHERKDKGNRIYTRLWDGKEYSSRRVLCDPIRTARGAIDRDKENEARQLATDRQRQVRLERIPDVQHRGPLTLARGFAKRLDPKEGEWPTVTTHVRQVRRAAKEVSRILHPDLCWKDLKHAHYRKLWRALTLEHQSTGKGGASWTERVVSILKATALWLQAEGHIEPGEGQPAAKWKDALRKDWQEIVGRPVPAPAKPRYTDAESLALWTALPKADPRLALAMEIGAELRLGQVIRVMRRDIRPHGDEPLGAIWVHGRGKKGGATVLLDAQSRSLLRLALESGYLRVLEAAFAAGEVNDYPLFPGHKLGDAIPVNRQRQITRSGFHGMWLELERLAGVPHMEGRAWYGVRRLQSDKAEDVESDARVLNKLGGWKHTATRERYQEEGRQDIAEKAAEARRKIRPTPTPDSSTAEPKVTPESYTHPISRFTYASASDDNDGTYNQ